MRYVNGISVVAAFALGIAYGVALHRNHVFPYELLRPPVKTAAVEATNPLYLVREPLLRDFPARDGSVAMLGDSLTDSAEWANIFPDTAISNQGISGDNIAGIGNRLDAVLQNNPRKVFIMAGINDLRLGAQPEAIFDAYRKIISSLAEKTTVYVESTLSVDESYQPGLNEKVATLNALLSRECSQTSLCTYLDLNQALRLPDRSLYIDGVHLTPEAYRRWRDAIEPSMGTAATARTKP